MARMTRSYRYGLLLLALLPACKAAGPKAPPAAPAAPDLLRGYEGEYRLLRHKGDERALTLKADERVAGDCDVAVRVRRAAFENGTARFALETVGLPNMGGREPRCKRMQAGIDLVLTGFPAAPAASDVTPRVEGVLLTPEAYLQSKGGAFNHPADKAPAKVASEMPDASSEERDLARSVFAWPRTLLSVNPYYRDPARKVHHEGFVEFEAVVGTDGRLHRPKLKTSLGQAHENAVLSALSLWRFEPAKRGDAPVGARVPLRLVFHIY
jgi:TonB family protein